MNELTLDAIRDCFDGDIPAVIATCAPDGTPNCSFASEVHFVDAEHVGLSYQFFNKTRANVLANPHACVMVSHRYTAVSYRIDVQYLRTEEAGPIFESMRAKLAGIASHTGMSGVFRLQGADIYRVLKISAIAGRALPTPPKKSLLAVVRNYSQATSQWNELAILLEGTLAMIESLLGVRHSMIHWLDESGERLFAVASRGYAQSGIGSEVQLGQGIVGSCARACTAIRIKHATSDYTYGRAVRESVRQSHLADRLEAEIPQPGLVSPGSQLAVAITARKHLLGVLYLESEAESRFGYDEEDAVVAIADHLGLAAQLLEQSSERQDVQPHPAPTKGEVAGRPVTIRHYRADETIFVGDDYLIKGVAGAILWKLLREYEAQGKQEFTNRELRLDSSLPLPDFSSNLEARLILLQRRLAERCAFIGIEKSGRGRFRFRVARPLQLLEAS
ncbi:MAG TPA: GAF domain-containing protein [Steroidobacteraceae bacterium]|nr:GAF domain-containing protein [Steroidobacteraceae bacterium]